MDDTQIEHCIRCTSTTRHGQPCRSWAVPGTDPPRCASHGGVSAKLGAPKGNQNAVTHGLYAKSWGAGRDMTIADFASQPVPNSGAEEACSGGERAASPPGSFSPDTLEEAHFIITQDLINKHMTLSHFIDQNFDKLPLPVLNHLLNLHAQTASRIGRLIQNQNAMAPESRSEMQDAMDKAFDELSEFFGIQL